MRFALSLIRHIKRSSLHHPILHNILTSFRRIHINRYWFKFFGFELVWWINCENNSTIFASANMTIGWNRKMLFQFSHWHYCLHFRRRCRFIPLSSCYFVHGISALLSYVIFVSFFIISFLLWRLCSQSAAWSPCLKNHRGMTSNWTLIWLIIRGMQVRILLPQFPPL